MTKDQITLLTDAIMDMAEKDRGLVKSKLRALVQMHVINAEYRISPTLKKSATAFAVSWPFFNNDEVSVTLINSEDELIANQVDDHDAKMKRR